MTGWTSHNGLANTITYDSDGRPVSISVPGVESLAFGYDAANRITHITDGMNNADSQGLSYDAAGRLTGFASSTQTASFSYDADGNRIQQVRNGETGTFTYAANSNRLLGSGGGAEVYGYDADGNLTTVNGHTAYTYGPFNRLEDAAATVFVIDAEGQRLEKAWAGGQTWAYFAPDAGGALLAEELDGKWLDYVWLNGRLVSLVESGNVYALHDDQTGRPIAMTNSGSTAIMWQAVGYPFARSVTANHFGEFDLGLPGQYYDSEDGLWHNGYRDYDAATGRYIEPDPLGLGGGINAYAYAGDNPVSLVDPLGLCKTCEGNAEYSAVGPHQAPDGALGVHPPMGSVAISPAAFGLPYNTISQRVAAQRTLRSIMGSVTIAAPALNLAGGPTSSQFTIGDVGDINIRGSLTTRFDIYRFDSTQAADKFGVQTAMTVVSNLPDSMSCPFGWITISQ